MSGNDETLSIQEASKALGVSVDTIRRRIKNKTLAAELKDGSRGSKSWRIPVSAIHVAKEVKDVVKFDRSIAPTELRDLIKEVLELRLTERDGAILEKIDDLDKKT